MAAATTPAQFEDLMRPQDAAAALGVDPKTLTRWVKSGKLSSIRTLGGHRRYRPSDILRILQEREERPCEEVPGDDGAA